MSTILKIDGWSFEPDQLMRPCEVAAALGVSDKSVNRWAREGKLIALRTPGRVRRYSREQVEHVKRGDQ